MTHTPGPWGCHSTSNHAHDYRITHANGTSIPVVSEANDHSEQRATAHLIAASPDLLAALEALFEHCAMVHKHWGEDSNSKQADAAQKAARAAIAKARQS